MSKTTVVFKQIWISLLIDLKLDRPISDALLLCDSSENGKEERAVVEKVLRGFSYSNRKLGYSHSGVGVDEKIDTTHISVH